MAFHIVVKDTENGRVLTDAISDSIALAYDSEEGVHGESFLHCNGVSALNLVLALDGVRDRILSQDEFLRILYKVKDEILSETVAIDIGAIKQALEGADE